MLGEGEGESVALYLMCVGEVYRLKNDCDSFAVINNTAELVEFVKARMRGKPVEVLEFYFMDKSSRVKRVCTFTDNDPGKVNVRPDEIIKLISVCRPQGVYIAHNHTNCPCEPSAADDNLTKKIQLICSLNNVKLYDHVIYGPDGVFSYFIPNRLDGIAYEYSAEKFFKDNLI